MTLSVVITTRNESANIANCIRAFDGFRGDVEVIVVDNGSTDGTKGIAVSLGAWMAVRVRQSGSKWFQPR